MARERQDDKGRFIRTDGAERSLDTDPSRAKVMVGDVCITVRDSLVGEGSTVAQIIGAGAA